MRGLRYAGIAALLSECLIFYCCSQWFLFHFLEVSVKGARIVRSVASPSQHMSMLTAFMSVFHADIFFYRTWWRQVFLLPNARSPRRRCLFGCDITTVDMTQPPQFALADQRVHIGKASTIQGINVGHVVLPLYFQDHILPTLIFF